MMMLGEKLKRARESSGKTQKEVADLIGLSKGVVGHYENGRSSPPMETIKKLAEIYAVPVGYLIGTYENNGTVDILKDELPKDLEGIGLTYLRLAKRMQDKGIPPSDLERLIQTIEEIKKR